MHSESSYYYNAPDGQKPLEKVIATTKWGFMFGMFCGTAEYTMYNYKKTPIQALNCLGYYVIPLTAMCAAYSTATYAATKIRNKDVPGNHAIGAMAATFILYKWQRNPIGALSWGVVTMVLAASYKHALQINYNVAPDVPRRTFNDGLFANHDFTWTKDPRPWKN